MLCQQIVCVPELGEVVEKRKEVTHNNESGSRPYFDQVTHFHNKFVFRFQLCKRMAHCKFTLSLSKNVRTWKIYVGNFD